MEKQINYPKNYSLLKEDESMYIDGGSWSYRGHRWNDSPLYAVSNTRAQMANAYGLLSILTAVVSVTVPLAGKIGGAVATMFGLATLGTKNIFADGRWNRAVQFCFQDGLHSNLYFTAYMKNNNILSYGSVWLYTN